MYNLQSMGIIQNVPRPFQRFHKHVQLLDMLVDSGSAVEANSVDI